ncbi:MAG: TonB-dependent receptor plug domain-containing protein, partial [Pirellulaceae bacterium]|nr:TonB-dependent receptor plug domain-containing protein [Pirellulaceae bacterium]
MSKRETRPFFAGSAAFAILAVLITTGWVTQAVAQDTSSEPMEEIVVTGSYIKRPQQKNYSSPIDIIGSEDIQRIGRTDIGALLAASPANSGSFVMRDTASSGLQSAANVNLRGLGSSSTLVLLNGRRQTQGGIPNREGQVFVDVNGLVPLIMVDRVEVVQDGTSALYGSDAMAGVVNFVTRDSFEGAEVQLEYRNAADGDGQIMTYSGIFGAGNDRGHLVAAVEYVDQNSIANEARFSDQRLTTGGFNSFFSTPATYLLIAGNTYNAPYDTLAGFITDPLCGNAEIGGLRAGLPGGATPGGKGVCRLGLALGGDLFPAEKRLNTLVRGHIDINDSTEAFGEFGFSQIRTHRTDSPSYPVSNASIIIPANNPGNFFGDAVKVYTRPVGVNASSRPRILTESDTFRVLAGLRGDLGNSDWTYELSALHSENDQFNTDNDELVDRFIAAVNGVGGPNSNQFFNPFGSQFLASPGSSLYNPPEVFADFMIERFRKTTASMNSIDGVITGKLDQGDLIGGPIGVALGFNFRQESLEGD